MEEVKESTYYSMLKQMPSFLSLDISKRSTGYVMWYENKLEFGCKAFKTADLRETKRQFSNWLREKINGKHFEVYLVEDIIRSQNFETFRVLSLLNGVIDDLMIYNIIEERPVYRMSAVKWNKILYDNTGGTRYTLDIGANRKLATIEALKKLGFDVFTEIERESLEMVKKNSYEDIADAMGLAMSYYYLCQNAEIMVLEHEEKPLRADLRYKYSYKQYKTEAEMRAATEKVLKRTQKYSFTHFIAYNPIYRNIVEQFKAEVESIGKDDGLFMIKVPIQKVGYPFLTEKMDVTEDIIYFMAKKK